MAKAQIFLFDLVVGIGVFITAVILFIFLSNNMSTGTDDFGMLVENADAISTSLLSAGQPSDWAWNNVSLIGVTEDSYRLNFTKVRIMQNLSVENASRIFGTNSNFVIFFKNMEGNVLNFGSCTVNNANLTVQNVSPSFCQNFTITPQEHLVSVERLVLYNSEIIKIVVQTWI